MSLPLRCFFVLMAISTPSWSATVTFTVQDKNGKPLTDAVVSLIPDSHGAKQAATQATAPSVNMTQSDKQFSPHIVAVQRGKAVQFPNKDSIKHQVYSLSDLQQFDLTIEAGETGIGPEMHATGAINLGCNIHDWMQAYVYVVDTPWFNKSDQHGKVSLEIPDNESFTWHVWHPRIMDDETGLSGVLKAPYSAITIKMQSELLPAWDEAADFDDFDDY